jgi:S1-C subfamily serine protease
VLLPLLVLALAAPPAAAGPATPAPPAAAAVLVRGGSWAGSGVVWDSEARLVLTALHVVEEMPPERIEVTVRGGLPALARVVDRDPLLDLALLKVAGPLTPALPLGATASLAAGDSIAIAACPAARCGRGDGRVIAPMRAFAGSRYLAVAAEARPGASGGAVLDARGAVVGIVDLTLRREPGVALAIPIERAKARFPRS